MNAQPAFASHRTAKRSRNVRLTAMAAVAGSVMLAGCGEEPSVPSAQASAKSGGTAVQVYENVFDCKAKSGMSEDQCREAHKQATQAAEKDAPRFAALQDCEAEWGAGKCVEQKEADSTRSPHFYPFLTGFLVAKALRNSGTGRATPLFSKQGGSFQTANGTRLGYGGAPGKYIASARALEQPRSVPKMQAASSKAVAAGGLGGRATGGWTVGSRSSGSVSGASTSSRGG